MVEFKMVDKALFSNQNYSLSHTEEHRKIAKVQIENNRV